VTGAPDRKRLAKLLAMFSSDFDGEIVNAARMAETLRHASGHTWQELLNVRVRDDRKLAAAAAAERRLLNENKKLRAEVERLKAAIERSPVPAPWADAETDLDGAQACLLWRQYLNDWESGFLESLLRRGKPLIDRQIEVLERIGERVDRAIRNTSGYRRAA
jgi:hypothetical protein